MHYGFKIVDDMIDGLNTWMDGQGYARIEDFRRGKAVPNVTDWQYLNMNYKIDRPDRTRISASNAGAATSPARTPRTSRSPPSGSMAGAATG